MQKFIYERKFGFRDRAVLAVASVLFALYAAFSLTYFAGSCKNISESVVRLHILANSDSERDQSVKLAVRDALLKRNTELLTKGITKENAERYFEASKDELQKTANDVLKERGFDYSAEIKLCSEIYPTREYGELTFPAGEYTSVKVVLGSGKGHNWWCVMFPPLCVPAATGEIEESGEELSCYLDKNGEKIVTSGEKYKVKFKLLEWFEEIFK